METSIGKCYNSNNKRYFKIIGIEDRMDVLIEIEPERVSVQKFQFVPSNTTFEISDETFNEKLNEAFDYFRNLKPVKEKYFTDEQMQRIYLVLYGKHKLPVVAEAHLQEFVKELSHLEK